MPRSVLSVYRYYFNLSYVVNITVICILQKRKLRNRVITYFAQDYKGNLAFKSVLSTVDHKWQVTEQQLGVVWKELTVIMHDRD